MSNSGYPPLTPLAVSLPASVPFVSPDAQERALGHRFRARLGANESVFGPSPRAIEAMSHAARDVWMYGDSEAHDLRLALARHHDIAPDCIVVGEGIDGLLGYLVRLTVAPGDAVVTSDGAYPTFNYHVAGYGGSLLTAPYRDDREDIDALLDLARESDAKLIYLANPDNPMGSWHEAAAVEDAIARLPEGCLLVLDEAYVDFAPEGVAPAFDTSERGVIRMRTFSKAYGLAGLRIGWAVGQPDLIRAFDKVRNHFGVGRLAQLAAMAALEDEAWRASVLKRTEKARTRIAEIAESCGLAPLPSATNFVTVDCRRSADFARALVAALAARGVFIRMPFAAPGNRCVRISCGAPDDLRLLETVLPDALEEAGQQADARRERTETMKR